MHGIVDEKTDVFAFGVLLLEIITGRRAVDTASRQSIVMWVMVCISLLVLQCYEMKQPNSQVAWMLFSYRRNLFWRRTAWKK